MTKFWRIHHRSTLSKYSTWCSWRSLLSWVNGDAIKSPGLRKGPARGGAMSLPRFCQNCHASTMIWSIFPKFYGVFSAKCSYGSYDILWMLCLESLWFRWSATPELLGLPDAFWRVRRGGGLALPVLPGQSWGLVWVSGIALSNSSRCLFGESIWSSFWWHWHDLYIITYRGSPQKTDDAECCCCTKARTVTHRGVLSQVDTAYTCFFSVCGKVRVFLFINSQGFNCCLLWLHVILQVDHWLETIRIQLHFLHIQVRWFPWNSSGFSLS